jgi:hypothetical protein
MRSIAFATAAVAFALGFSADAVAQKKYGPGVTDSEIKIGQTMPYSGPASSLAVFGRIPTAYFRKINASGGINGRKVTLISLDDAFFAAKDSRTGTQTCRERRSPGDHGIGRDADRSRQGWISQRQPVRPHGPATRVLDYF